MAVNRATLLAVRHTPHALRVAAVVLLTAGVAGLAAGLPPVPQWAAYHDFADRRALFGIQNFFNVASNGLLVLVGAAGLYRLLAAALPFVEQRERRPYLVFFLGIALTGVASAWYHLEPGNERLVWDRLALSIALTSWLAAVIAERIRVAAGLALLPALIALGAAAVLYWGASEARDAGDLRAYGVIHFYPALLIPLLMLLFPPRYSRGGDVLVVLALYGAALAAELLDRPLFALGGVLSGHTLKHGLAALAAYWVLRMLRLRRPIASGNHETTPPTKVAL